MTLLPAYCSILMRGPCELYSVSVTEPLAENTHTVHRSFTEVNCRCCRSAVEVCQELGSSMSIGVFDCLGPKVVLTWRQED